MNARKPIRWLRMFAILFLALVLGLASMITGIAAVDLWMTVAVVVIGPMLIYAIYVYIRMLISGNKRREAESRALAAQNNYRKVLRDNDLKKDEKILDDMVADVRKKNQKNL
jgi:hypothetical protein